MEFHQLLERLGINEQEVLERFCGNEALLQRFLLQFPEEKTFGELSTAYQANELEKAEWAVHTLKGIAANLGLIALQGECTSMLEDLRESKGDLAQEFQCVCREYERVVSHIREYRISSKA